MNIKGNLEVQTLMKKIIIIGGGAAGMMAAGRAAECGTKVTLLEKTNSLGNKLLITGKDRCNFTNTAPLKEFISKFGKKGNFLYPAFYNFFNEDLIKFFKKLNVPSKEERGGRVFPQSDRSKDIQNALVHYVKKSGVEICLRKSVKEIVTEGKSICAVKTKDDEIMECDRIILCTGGMSYPATGSTGDGYNIAQKLGHTIIQLRPALVPLDTAEKWVRELQGLTVKNVNVNAKDNNGKKICEEFGDMLFTHFGVSGPIILSMSKKIGENLERSRVFLHIDLKPALNFEKLDLRIQSDFKKYSNKLFSNALDDLLPKSLIPVIVQLSSIPKDKVVHSITKQERLDLVKLLKSLRLEVSRTYPITAAIITNGGISLKEVDHHTMESKFIKGLYFAGEILDIDATTGGYNLQMAFSTGRLAGESASKCSNSR